MSYAVYYPDMWGPEEKPPNWIGVSCFVLLFALGLGLMWLVK